MNNATHVLHDMSLTLGLSVQPARALAQWAATQGGTLGTLGSLALADVGAPVAVKVVHRHVSSTRARWRVGGGCSRLSRCGRHERMSVSRSRSRAHKGSSSRAHSGWVATCDRTWSRTRGVSVWFASGSLAREGSYIPF